MAGNGEFRRANNERRGARPRARCHCCVSGWEVVPARKPPKVLRDSGGCPIPHCSQSSGTRAPEFRVHAAFRSVHAALRRVHVALRSVHAALRRVHAALRSVHAALRRSPAPRPHVHAPPIGSPAARGPVRPARLVRPVRPAWLVRPGLPPPRPFSPFHFFTFSRLPAPRAAPQTPAARPSGTDPASANTSSPAPSARPAGTPSAAGTLRRPVPAPGSPP